jgi:2,3-bisphosphoglycerate-dependent phosphoglycerate mutase
MTGILIRPKIIGGEWPRTRFAVLEGWTKALFHYFASWRTVMERLLVLVRHGQSEWNRKNLFTGWRDVDLSEVGVEEAHAAGRKLGAMGLRFDVAYTSALIRAQHTLKILLDQLGQPGLEHYCDQALNERDYGELVGLDKDDARQKWGDNQVRLWRRSYDVRPPGGESLRDTGARVWPYYITHVLPDVMRGRRALVAAHGNSLRALVMVLDRLTTDTVEKLEIPTGVPLVYRLNPDTTVAAKQVLSTNGSNVLPPVISVPPVRAALPMAGWECGMLA